LPLGCDCVFAWYRGNVGVTGPGLQKLSFALLVALVLYAAFTGAA
jgi:hypothetical protein